MKNNKCELCNKHRIIFTNIDTNQKICFICGVKEQYKINGLKGVLKTLKFCLKVKWILCWENKLNILLKYITRILITIIPIISLIYIILIKKYWLILNSIISLIAVILLWED